MLALFREILTKEWRLMLWGTLAALAAPFFTDSLVESLPVPYGVSSAVLAYPYLVFGFMLQRRMTREKHSQAITGAILVGLFVQVVLFGVTAVRPFVP